MQIRTLALLVALILGSGCGATGSDKVGVPDDAIGLSKVDIRETAVPEPVPQNATDPGERPTTTPAFPGSPPVIPHGIDDFLPITRSENMCVDCHQVEEKVAGEPTPIPASHFVDLRHAPDQSRDVIAGARANCLACHALRRDVKPLVPNDFSEEG
jgi:cytochrome c-type protein NapB